jgi:cbb3-type cytochrome oxidase maturation protein
MSVLIFLIPLALILSVLGLLAFIWSLKSKQYDDLEGSAKRILFDESDEKKD